MRFSQNLEKLMRDMCISQTKLSELTGIGKSSISQYLSGKNEPSRERKREIARAFGVEDNYFDAFLPDAEIRRDSVNVPTALIAALMGKSKLWVEKGLQDGVFPWGYAVKMKRWSYFVSAVKFTEYTGIDVPVR